MRRFITSLPGRAVAYSLSMALVLPYISFVLAGNAGAQLTQLPSWAVLEFENKAAKGGAGFGKTAAEAVHNELAKSGRVDTVPQENIQRSMTELGQIPPLRQKTDILRLAQEVQASSVVTGTLLGWRTTVTGSGKYAEATIQVVVTDVASGLAVNGALVKGQSTTRAGDASDETLVSEALSSAAAQAVLMINSQILPTGTVLNTTPNEALINQGERTGFKKGQEIIVLRGRQQVATATVVDTDPDSARLRVTKSILGIQPGDKVRAIFPVPEIGGDLYGPSGGQPTAKRARRPLGSGSGIGSLAVVLGLAVFLFGGGRASGGTLAHDVISEAMLYPDFSGQPAVRISWTPDIFVKAKTQRVQWQIWRSDVVDTPVLIVDGDRLSGVDTTDTRDVNWQGAPGGGTECFGDGRSTDTGVPGVTPGRPYQYQVQLLYIINSLDLPGGNTSGTGTGTTTGTGTGTTGTATTGTTTSGTTVTGTGTTGTTTGTTTGGTTTAGQDCFFVSPKSTAKGLATPYNRANLVSPASNAVITGRTVFTFQSVVNALFPTTVNYVLQFSTTPQFPRTSTVTVADITRNDLGNLSITVETDAFFPGAGELWWRIGARNTADVPGPLPDPSGQRFIFSAPRRFTRPGPPPPPP